MLRARAAKILICANSAFSEISVVNAPGPAISGNTTGIRVASFVGPPYLKISTSRSISKAMMKMMSAPATANDWMSTWKSCSTASPA